MECASSKPPVRSVWSGFAVNTGARSIARLIFTVPLRDFLAEIKAEPPLRVPGTAIFMYSNRTGTPPALVHNIEHNKQPELIDAITAATQTMRKGGLLLGLFRPELAKQQPVEASGFVFDGECNALRNPADPRTKVVLDPSIRGRTDQIIYRFRKPSRR